MQHLESKSRYLNILDNTVLCETNFLLSASCSQGDVYDKITGCFVDKLPYQFLLEGTFEALISRKMLDYLTSKDILVSNLLAETEGHHFKEIKFPKILPEIMLFIICAHPEIKIYIGDVLFMRGKKRLIDRDTGEVTDVEFENPTEKAVYNHWDFLKEVDCLVKNQGYAIAQGATADILGVSQEALDEAIHRLLGRKPNKKSWRDFFK